MERKETVLHLTAWQITAYRDGELEDQETMDHLASCAVCQARLIESRRLAGMLQLPLQGQPLRHPTARTLAAYFDDSLAPRRRERVEQHIKQCERCTAELDILRQVMQDLERQ